MRALSVRTDNADDKKEPVVVRVRLLLHNSPCDDHQRIRRDHTKREENHIHSVQRPAQPNKNGSHTRNMIGVLLCAEIR